MDQSFQNPAKRSERSSVHTHRVHDVAVAQEVSLRGGSFGVRSLDRYGRSTNLTVKGRARDGGCCLALDARARPWRKVHLKVKAAWYEAYCAVAEAMQQGERQAKAAGEVLSPGSDRKGDG